MQNKVNPGTEPTESVSINNSRGRPLNGGVACVYVPREGFEQKVSGMIKSGSGIVGYPLDALDAAAMAAILIKAAKEADEAKAAPPTLGTPESTLIMVYFEGNLFGAENMKTWCSKVRQSYGRMVQKYPTVARACWPSNELECVGTTNGNVVTIENMPALTRWLTWSCDLKSAPTSGEDRLPERPSPPGRRPR